MSVFGCCHNPFAALSKAAAKAASARLRNLALIKPADNWVQRATVCERCHLRKVYQGVSYCGKPLLMQINRTAESEGCGCPTQDKAKSPSEHCPLDRRHQAARVVGNVCNCKWCELSRSRG